MFGFKVHVAIPFFHLLVYSQIRHIDSRMNQSFFPFLKQQLVTWPFHMCVKQQTTKIKRISHVDESIFISFYNIYKKFQGKKLYTMNVLGKFDSAVRKYACTFEAFSQCMVFSLLKNVGGQHNIL